MTITLEDANGRVLAEITPGEGQRVRIGCVAVTSEIAEPEHEELLVFGACLPERGL